VVRIAGIAIFVLASLCLINSPEARADCPSADLTGDCFVDFDDFAVIGAQWLNLYDWNDVNSLAIQWLTTDPCAPNDMVYIPYGEFNMGDHHDDSSDSLPIHAVTLDLFFMSTCEITNQQYCDYLNSALGGGIYLSDGIVYGSGNNEPYCDTHICDNESQIDYNDLTGTFSVRTKDSRDMSNDPMVEVSWYGAVAYCNWRSSAEGRQQCYNLSTWECDFSKLGYRLPTEAEWEYAARGGEQTPYYRFPWGDTISHTQANYFADPCSFSYDVNPTVSFHPDWNDEIFPYTSVVGSFSPNGYGLYDMAGNICEWCSDWYDPDYYSVSPYDNPTGPAAGTYRVLRGGSWGDDANFCAAAYRFGYYPDLRGHIFGFRIVLDLE